MGIFKNKEYIYDKILSRIQNIYNMRKILLLAFLFGGIVWARSAEYEYVPLVRDGAEWGYSQQLFGKSYYHNLIQGDTLVNGEAYKKFYTFQSCEATAGENLAFVREDDKKVYITFNAALMPVESLYSTEYLIYDFGAGPGDTVTYFDWMLQQPVVSVIDKIDTVEVGASLRQRFWADDKVLWIEGLGVEEGDWLRPGCSTDVGGLDTQDRLVYMKAPDGTMEYETADAVNDPCYVSRVDEIDSDSWHVVRRGDWLEITFPEGLFDMAELLDLSGRVLWCDYLSGQSRVSLPVAAYPRGVYIVALSSAGKRVSRRVMF